MLADNSIQPRANVAANLGFTNLLQSLINVVSVIFLAKHVKLLEMHRVQIVLLVLTEPMILLQKHANVQLNIMMMV